MRRARLSSLRGASALAAVRRRKTFPQAQFRTRLLNTFVVPILNRPVMRSKFDKKFREQMVRSHKRVVAETQAGRGSRGMGGVARSLASVGRWSASRLGVARASPPH